MKEAIEKVDEATDSYPMFYTVNCVHLVYFAQIFEDAKDEPWIKRIKALRPNASKKSHEELDQSDTLDDGDVEEFGADLKTMKDKFPNLSVIGGCCGTDQRHCESFISKYLHCK